MQLLIQQLVDGVASGALYGAMALSLVLVYRASGIVNFAQGEMAMFSAFVTLTLSLWGVPLLLAIGLSMLTAFIFGAIVEFALIRPFGGGAKSHMPLIIVTLGLMLIINGAAGWIWGYMARQVPPVFGSGAIPLGPAQISYQSLGIVAAVCVVSTLLFLLYQRTPLGLRLRAASSNPESARLSGIRVGSMLMLGWALAAAIGALVGSAVAPQLYLHPNMMAPLLLYAFAAATLGGFDSPPGALVGGVIVGVTENLVGAYVPFIGNDFKQAVALAIIMVVLLVKPEGLFGTKKVVRV